MSYYSKNKIFDNSRVNALMDRFFFEAANAIPDVDIATALCLTGKAAALLQDANFDEPACNNIILLTNDPYIHNSISEKLPKLIEHSGVVRLQGRTLFYFPDAWLEIWCQEGQIFTTRVNEIVVQELKSINPDFL